MVGRVALLVVGLGLTSGCGGSRQSIHQDVPSELTSTVHDLGPRSNSVLRTPRSPYDFRGVPKEEVKEAKVEVAQPTPKTPPEPPAPEKHIAVSHVAPVEKAAPSPLPKLPEAPPPQPSKPKDPLVAALECYRAGKIDEGNASLKKVDPAARDLLVVLMPLVARLERTCKTGKPAEYSALLEKIETLAQQLRPRAALTVEKMCFCRTIKKFGVYEPLPPTHAFQAASENKPGDGVLLYVELRNFAGVQRGALTETALACKLEIHNARGEVVYRKDVPAQVEQSRSPRHDGYLPCHFYVPPGFAPGEYALWIHVKDVTGQSEGAVPAHRIASRSIPFRIRHADYAMTGN